MRKIALYFALLFSAFFSSNALSEYSTTIDKNSLKVFFDIFDLADYATPPDPNDDLGAWVGWKRWYEEYYRTPFHRSLAVAYPKNNIKSGDFSGFCFIPGWTNRNEADAAAIDCCNEFKEKSHTCTILFRNNDILDKNYLAVLNPKIPANAYASGTSWKCKSGYEKNIDTCKKKEIPANAKVSGSSWTCLKGYKKVGSRCNKIYVPVNASLSGDSWKCNTGFTKDGNSCNKVEESMDDYIDELKKIKELLDSGVINKEDFEKLKKNIINKVGNDISSNNTKSNKFKNNETYDDYFDLEITDEIEVKSLFGFNLYDSVQNSFSINYINSNKLKNNETYDDYFDLEITDEVEVKSSYASEYWISFDNFNIIHSVYGADIVNNLDICLEAQESLLSNLEEKYQVDFGYKEDSYPGFKIYRYEFYDKAGNHYALQCNDDYEYDVVKRQIYIETEKMLDSIDKFYDSGL